MKIKFLKNIASKLLISGLIIFFIISSGVIIWLITLPIPDFESFFQERILTQSTKLYDKTGEILLYDAYGDIRRTVIDLEEINDFTKLATIAIEDSDFYNHKGIKISSIVRAFLVNIGTGNIQQGGSTLTQQVIKNTLLTQDKKISRKLKEWVLAVKLERIMTKDEILELYLNETPYGGNVYGIEEASIYYFNKQAKDLNLVESAYLAALPQAPSLLSPYGKNKQRLEERKNLVLKRMSDLKMITKEQYEESLKEEVEFTKPRSGNIIAPHFVFFILEQLENKYGEDLVRNKGLKVITTIDAKTQEIAENLVREHAEKNKEYNATNAGMVVLDPKTGQILAMVGSKDYFDIENEGNFNVTTAKRQPGSAFKPIVYAAAFNKGYTPQTVVFDLPTEFNTNCTPEGRGVNCYMPQNYDGTFVGPISLKNALAQSKNIPAVKVLYLVGIDEAIKLARNLGITTLTNPARYGLSLVLGGGEVTLLEMVSAYGVFANEGLRLPYTGIIKVEDLKGNTLDEFKKTEQQVISPEITRIISDILSDNEARTPVFGPRSSLYIEGYDVAVKTGTTNNFRDGWIIGYTPSVVVGAWVGNNDNSPIDQRVAGYIVGPLWNQFMRQYLVNKPIERFNGPVNENNLELKPILRGVWQGGETYLIDSISKKRATELTPPELIEEVVIQSVHSILYWVDKNNPRGPKPNNPNRDPQFNLWETPVRNWAASRGLLDQSINNIPQQFDDVHTEDKKPNIKILNKENINYNLTDQININVQTSGFYPITQVDYFINDIFIGSVKENPFSFTIDLKNINILNNKNTIKVIVYDSVRNKNEDVLEININN